MERQAKSFDKAEAAAERAASDTAEDSRLSKPEKYMIAAALIMGALLIVYNALAGAPLASPQVLRVAAESQTAPQSASVPALIPASSESEAAAPESNGEPADSAAAVSEPAAPPAGSTASAVTSYAPISAPPASSKPAASKAPGKLQPGETIDLNTAGAEELMRLPGVGEKTAAAILAYRQKVGSFRSVYDLDFIDGIGAKTIEKIAPYVRIEE